MLLPTRRVLTYPSDAGVRETWRNERGATESQSGMSQCQGWGTDRMLLADYRTWRCDIEVKQSLPQARSSSNPDTKRLDIS